MFNGFISIYLYICRNKLSIRLIKCFNLLIENVKSPMICSKDNEELNELTKIMYEIRKWIIKPVLKEVVHSNINFQALEEIIAEIIEDTGLNEKEFFDLYEVEEMETGLMNNEVLASI